MRPSAAPHPQTETAAGDGGWRTQAAVRRADGAEAAVTDRIAEEVPVALVFNGISHAVMMATPCDLEAFAAGFALSEGIIASATQIYDVEVQTGGDALAGVSVHMTIAQEAFQGMKQKRRSLAGRSGCGVCGIESIELLDLMPEPVATGPAVPAEAIAAACAALPKHQRLMQVTGGVHAAAWCTPEGHILSVFEDVGRHNALDKLIGHRALHREAFGDGFVLMSSRASYELVRKAARMGIPMLATISAPTSLAIDIAQRAGVRLVSFCRASGFVEYVAAPAHRGEPHP